MFVFTFVFISKLVCLTELNTVFGKAKLRMVCRPQTSKTERKECDKTGFMQAQRSTLPPEACRIVT